MLNVVFMIHLILTVVLVAVILVQRSDSDGMGSLGGGGGGNALFSGRGKATFLTRLTAMLATGFFLTSIGLAYLSYQRTGSSIMDTVPATPAQPNPAAPDGTLGNTAPEAPASAPSVPKAD